MSMKQKMFFVILGSVIFASGAAFAKVKVVQKPVEGFDFRSIDGVVVELVTSNNTDMGKVADFRKKNIDDMLERSKKDIRQFFLESQRLLESNLPMYDKTNAVKKFKNPVILRLNVDVFDNGNMMARKLPLMGKAKVGVTAQIVSFKDKRVLAELNSKAKTKTSMVGNATIGFAPDSECLAKATTKVSADIYKYIMKLTEHKYNMLANMGERAGKGAKRSVEVLADEKPQSKKK